MRSVPARRPLFWVSLCVSAALYLIALTMLMSDLVAHAG
jgi:hypothetical protein